MTQIELPPGFLFGAATSAYQIEGGWDADGKGLSIWDRFTHQKGHIHKGQNGDTAADTYRDFQTDIDIMREMGLDVYRFSVSWPRVMPEGRGRVNEKGLDYYERLVDALLAAGITPFPTLFHWDLPLALEEENGGFAHRDTVARFADYAEVMARRLGDRVGHWITVNEPWVHSTFGYLLGSHAPGRRNPWAFLRTVHHQLLGHGLAMQRIKAQSPHAQVGISLNLTPIYPATTSVLDHHARDMADQMSNRLFLDPLFRGRYPDLLWSKVRLFHPRIQPGDMESIAQPLDFLGVNYYTRATVRYSRAIPYLHLWTHDIPVMIGSGEEKEGVEYTDMAWEVYPAGLFELLFRLRNEYGNPPVYVTENGAAFVDVVNADGRVRDDDRRAYLAQHLAVTGAAAKVGVNVRGYFVWSLIDNFEWTYGYDKRFGIVRVDYDTQQRTIKDSGRWYADLIRTSRATDGASVGSEGTQEGESSSHR
jgi:beta-glucosidase